MTFLLDANVLIALLDPQHMHHDPAHAWFDHDEGLEWATCPLTENAVVRIISQSSYPNPVDSPASAIGMLRELCGLRKHQFWPDSVSLLDPEVVEATTVLSHARITDLYLLALAIRRGGSLATFDKRLVANASPEWRASTRLLLS
jgi:toxin-antitoxin system PIN domain toxin